MVVLIQRRIKYNYALIREHAPKVAKFGQAFTLGDQVGCRTEVSPRQLGRLAIAKGEK